MFTNDPVRGDPSKLVLNLVDGDGEKLVNGHANPTQLVISKRDMSILERVICALKTRIVCLVRRRATNRQRMLEIGQSGHLPGALF